MGWDAAARNRSATRTAPTKEPLRSTTQTGSGSSKRRSRSLARVAATVERESATGTLTVISRPAPERLVIDVGMKSISHEFGIPEVVGLPGATLKSLSEEHGTLDLSACPDRPAVGDVVSIVPNHCCVVSNMVDQLYGIRGDRVEVVWPVAARGKVV